MHLDALEVNEFVLKEGLKWKGKPLTVSLLEAVPNDLRSHAVTVSNIDKVPTSNIEELLTLYFENSKASYGGPVKSIVLCEDGKSAVISFQDGNGEI